MKTAYNYGREYAEAEGAIEPVDINKMVGGSVDIPEGDYIEMRRNGIEPNPREYWRGYNDYCNS